MRKKQENGEAFTSGVIAKLRRKNKIVIEFHKAAESIRKAILSSIKIFISIILSNNSCHESVGIDNETLMCSFADQHLMLIKSFNVKANASAFNFRHSGMTGNLSM